MVKPENRRGQPSITYGTLGLSRHLLTMRRSGRPARQELLVPARDDNRAWSWVAALGEQALATHRAYLRGDVTAALGFPTDPLVPGSSVTGFFFTSPTYWPDELALHQDDDGTVVIVLAVPVTTPEQE